MELRDEVEAGCENVTISLKSNLDYYVGKVYEAPGPDGKYLCVVKEITSVKIKNGKLSLDAIVHPFLEIAEK